MTETPNLGNCTLWELAYGVRDKEFVSQPAVSQVVDNEWYGNLQQDNLRIITAIFLPLYLLVFVPIGATGETNASSLSRLINNLGLRMDNSAIRRSNMGYWNTAAWRIREFYNSTAAHFWLDALSFTTLLLLASYAAISETVQLTLDNMFSTDGQVAFFVLSVWMATLILDEIRQLATDGPAEYFSSMWNYWDILLYSLFTAVFVTRLSDRSDTLQVCFGRGGGVTIYIHLPSNALCPHRSAAQ